MRIRSGLSLTLLLLAFILPLASAQQEDNGSTLAQAALNLAKQSCLELNRNQVCYGHNTLSAESRPSANTFNLATVGDIEDLAEISSLRLSRMDIDAGVWGVALMELRANLPDGAAENVTVVAFGDVMLENAVPLPTHAQFQLQIPQNINVRQRPVQDSGVIGTLAPQQTVTVVDRLADSSWLRVMLPEIEQTGWVRRDLINTLPDLSNLNVTSGSEPYIQEPMQAFYFSSGANTVSELPASGLIIQTPEGIGEVQLLINEISVQLGSTVFFQTQPGLGMTIATLEGHADVRAFGIEQTAYAGTQVTVPLTLDLKPSGPPSPPQPYDQRQMNQLPISILQRSVVAATPLTYVEIQERLAQNAELNSLDSDNAEIPGSDSLVDPSLVTPTSPFDQMGGNNDCPGQSCNAPGHGGSCPGNSCNAPGHNKEDKDD
jgi:hypothetical protein